MIRIIFTEEPDKIPFSEVNNQTPIFAKQGKELRGMIVNEDPKGWILRIGGCSGATGHYLTLKECIESCLPHGYTFHIE